MTPVTNTLDPGDHHETLAHFIRTHGRTLRAALEKYELEFADAAAVAQAEHDQLGPDDFEGANSWATVRNLFTQRSQEGALARLALEAIESDTDVDLLDPT